MDESNFSKMISELKTLSELQTYADAQFKTIINLNKQVTELKAKNASLEQAVLALPAGTSNIIQFPQYSISPEEEICIKQLNDLNNESKNRPLTYEEAKKLEVYTKVLASIRNKTQDLEGKYKKLTTEELLAMSEVPNESK
jgi:hypothetical protein